MSRVEGSLPLVAVVGRPNVGKSTLYNRLIRSRKAITDPTRGVTRDPVETVCSLAGRRVRLVDTGGIVEKGEDFSRQVTGRSLDVLHAADVIVLLMDVTEISPEDDYVIELLRPFTRRVVLAVNKVDNPEREQAVWNFHRFGFKDVIGISAAHGLYVPDLEELIASRLPDEPETPEQAEPWLTLTILGKPNTGKSTLINRLTACELSLVSDVPGTTRDVIEGEFVWQEQQVRVLDTAGIRRKSKVTADVEYYTVNRALQSVEQADVAFLLIDAQEGLAEQDKKIAAQVVKHGRGIIIVLNKWDTLPRDAAQFKEMLDRVRFFFPVLEYAPVVPISARTGYNIKKLLETAVRIREQLDLRIETSRLNQALGEWLATHGLPYNRGKPWKVRFMTQVSVRPSRFVVFVNRVRGFPDSYLGYLRNKLRGTFDLGDIPLDIVLSAGKRSE
jgi:GTP-binding protein